MVSDASGFGFVEFPTDDGNQRETTGAMFPRGS